MSIRNKFFGNKAFYLMILAIAVPIMVQNGITNFVNLLDNVMVGRIGTEEMTGVAIVNQLLFVYNLCVFGGMSGAGIFTAQYFGQKDHKGVADTFRFKLWMGAFLTIVAILIFIFGGTQLIQLYLTGKQDGGDVALALLHGRNYLNIMLLSLPAFLFGQIYASTLRECGETLLPMKAGIIAVFVNLALNYVLIYGQFGFPKLGVVGAALATVIARYLETIIIIIYTHVHANEHPYIIGIYKTLKLPVRLVQKVIIKGTPLLFNETLWSMGMAMLLQCYSIRGMNVVAGMNIANTINNLFNVVFIALGDAIAIVVGQLLGAGKMDEAKDTDRKMIVFSVLCCTGIAIIMFIIAPLFTKLYNTSALSKELAVYFIMIMAVFMPQNAFMHATYFTLRSGGKTIVTFIFDSVFIWCISVPLAFILGHFTNLHVVWMLIFINLADTIKCIIGFILVKKGIWLQNIVNE